MVRHLRLGTGLVLFAYVTTHFLNHALGLISLVAAEHGREVFLFVWRGWIGTVALYGSLFIHVGLAFWAIYRRRTLRMHAWEWVQLGMGLCIPLLLAEHIIGTRLVHELHGTQDSYTYITLVLWVWAPDKGIVQSALLLVAWIHGCIGLHYWLRLKRWYSIRAPWFLVGAVIVPVLGLLGFNQLGHEVELLVKNDAWMRNMVAALQLPTTAQAEQLYRILFYDRVGFVAVLLLTLMARGVRILAERAGGLVRLTYPGGKVVTAFPGCTVLEASRFNGISHASVCGGRGRCSTCRVRVGRGAEFLPPPSVEEKRVLDRVGAPPQVRLACQLRPTKPLEVMPLLSPAATPREAFARPDHTHGSDQVIAVLFADLRSFTQFAEKRLPYDVVFVLNRYFHAMGEAITSAGGHLDKFIGDGVMALFGTLGDPPNGARAALNAARNMALKLQELNDTLKSELEAPLRIGIGIHAGHAIIGEMGYERATSLTAIGDTVNTASRLESMTKELKAQLVVSEAVTTLGDVDLSAYPRHEVAIRGREEMLAVRAVLDASVLPPLEPLKKETPRRREREAAPATA
ncbi:MAG: adenylate/guanylate cyclase domain-containing protein [Rhodospirillaceae bacterium]|nr:adenylate/guanylate cyclase domain-containing protein [Rhodospirillaceae bacterium]